jgi:DNA gyrase inhibitor GyrI
VNDLAVRIVKLEPLRVASFHGFGPSPEALAAAKLAAWAGPRGLLTDLTRPRIFGFNNPNPSAGSPNYGYEFWLVVGPEFVASEDEAESDMRIRDFPGGLYAVTRCQGVENIGATWGRLAQWLTESRYGHAGHQWLEEHLNPSFPVPGDELLLDLYAPIAG